MDEVHGVACLDSRTGISRLWAQRTERPPKNLEQGDRLVCCTGVPGSSGACSSETCTRCLLGVNSSQENLAFGNFSRKYVPLGSKKSTPNDPKGENIQGYQEESVRRVFCTGPERVQSGDSNLSERTRIHRRVGRGVIITKKQWRTSPIVFVAACVLSNFREPFSI